MKKNGEDNKDYFTLLEQRGMFKLTSKVFFLQKKYHQDGGGNGGLVRIIAGILVIRF